MLAPRGLRALPLLVALPLVAACNRTSSQGAASASPGEPALTIDPADAKCSSNADCRLTMTQCSCDCGSPVNVAHAQKYAEAQARLCQSYEGIMCKMACNDTVICGSGVCRINK